MKGVFFVLASWVVAALTFSLISSSSEEKAEVEYEAAYISDGFDFPVGRPDGEGYYNAQAFGKNDHLGDDWNAKTGGNTDLGDPVYAVSSGYVKFAEDIQGGWGNVIRIKHKLPDGTMVESVYAHCDTLLVKKGNWVKRGEKIGTIGTAHGIYYAHLHFEMRSNTDMGIGGGYSSNTTGYLNPTEFIQEHRNLK